MFLLSYIKVICKIQPIGDQNIHFGPNWGWNAPLGRNFFQWKYIGLKLVFAPIWVWSPVLFRSWSLMPVSGEHLQVFLLQHWEHEGDVLFPTGFTQPTLPFNSFCFLLCFQASPFEKEKNLVNKNRGWEPIHQKCKANENTSRHNPKKKQKQTINKNHVKTLCKEDPWLRNDIQR
jgi:hypothetical protein